MLRDLAAGINILFIKAWLRGGISFVVNTLEITPGGFGGGTKLLLDTEDDRIRRAVVSILSNMNLPHAGRQMYVPYLLVLHVYFWVLMEVSTRILEGFFGTRVLRFS